MEPITLLKQLGFNQKEIEIYLKILEHGKITPATLAKITGIKRPTVYSTVKELLEKGVIVEDLAADKQFLLALPPEELDSIIRKDEAKLNEKKALIHEAIAHLQEFTKNTKYSIPKIQFVYEEDLEKFLFKATPAWNESIQKYDNTWWGFQDPSFVKHYQKWIDWYWTKGVPPDVGLKLLTSQSDIEQEMANRGYDKRIIKFWSGASNVTATTWVNGDYLVIIMTSQSPHYLVQIHDPLVAHNMRELFKGIWNNL